MKRTTKPLVILTNDPSITAWGYAVITSQESVLDVGCIKTEAQHKVRRIRKGDDTARRICEINQHLLRIIDMFHVDYLLSELPHGSQSASAAVMIGITTGVAQTLSDALKIPIEWYSEGDAKKHLLGRISASKDEIRKEINKLYNVPWTGVKYKDEAIADAMAVYNAATFESSFLKYYRQ